MITSDPSEIAAMAWKIFAEEHPDMVDELYAQCGQEPDIEQVIRVCWTTGFYHCLSAYTVGAIKDLSGPTKPEHN
jgi:hypothetical protein